CQTLSSKKVSINHKLSNIRHRYRGKLCYISTKNNYTIFLDFLTAASSRLAIVGSNVDGTDEAVVILDLDPVTVYLSISLACIPSAGVGYLRSVRSLPGLLAVGPERKAGRKIGADFAWSVSLWV